MCRAVCVLVAACAALPAVGCGTLVNQSEPGMYFNADNHRPYRIYGGVRTDGEHLLKVFTMVARGESVLSSSTVTEHDPATGEYGTRDSTSGPVKVLNAIELTLYFAADPLLSFAADTFLLPWDMSFQWRRLTGRLLPAPAKSAESAEKLAPPPSEKPTPNAALAEGSSPLTALSNNSFNQWQISGRIELPTNSPQKEKAAVKPVDPR